MNQSEVNFFGNAVFHDLLIQGLLLSAFLVLGSVLLFREFQNLLKQFSYDEEQKEIEDLK
jgi:hypothetical protein